MALIICIRSYAYSFSDFEIAVRKYEPAQVIPVLSEVLQAQIKILIHESKNKLELPKELTMVGEAESVISIISGKQGEHVDIITKDESQQLEQVLNHLMDIYKSLSFQAIQDAQITSRLQQVMITTIRINVFHTLFLIMQNDQKAVQFFKKCTQPNTFFTRNMHFSYQD